MAGTEQSSTDDAGASQIRVIRSIPVCRQAGVSSAYLSSA